jgi:negative regulator of sigma E activity
LSKHVTNTASTPEQRHLAALIDGESGPGGFEASIRAAEKDAALRGRFERALLIGQAMRGEPLMPAASAIAERVSAQLVSEPVSIRPRPRAKASRELNRPAAALALAASVVAVAVLVGPGLISGPVDSVERPALADSTAAGLGSLDVGNGVESATGVVSQWAMDEPIGSTALDELLVDHRERASASGLTGFIPYAAVVGQHGLR